ncbi:MAG TPA: helix-turn-helix domain-containing protein, partial [Terriglobales bacterium]|nr:helix-turn-helix domain-containing protein [Terriglobales bacterium]
LPPSVTGRDAVARVLDSNPEASLFDIVDDCQRRVIVNMLERCNWNQTEAAERFHIPLSTLNQKIKRLNIEIKRKNGK